MTQVSGPSIGDSPSLPPHAASIPAGMRPSEFTEDRESPKPNAEIESLVAFLRHGALLGKKVDSIASLVSGNLGTLESLVRLIHAHPPKSFSEERAKAKFVATGLLPLSEKSGGEIIIALKVEDFDTKLWSTRIDNIKGFVSRHLKSAAGRVRYLLVNPEEFNQLSNLAYDYGNRAGFLDTLTPEIEANRFFLQLIQRAISRRASDIHIEPTENADTVVRFRIDGALAEGLSLDEKVGVRLVNVVRTKAQVNFAEHRTAQDGKIFFNDLSAEERKVYQALEGHSLRVAVVPSIEGESVAIRILKNTKESSLSLERLGLRRSDLDKIERLIGSPSGVILVSGPTGSGKTTTLYSVLNALNKPDVKILTIEDPVEVRIPKITQCQVNRDKGFGFAEALRAFLRCDPDIILVGEVRDHETAEVMINASMTGHLVFSTIHTQSAIDVLPRLLQTLNVKESLLEDALLAVIAQRLVRRLCPDCAEPYDARGELNEAFGAELFVAPQEANGIPLEDDPDAIVMCKPMAEPNSDCSTCKGVGYAGQIIVPEIWEIGAEEQALISQRVLDVKQLLDLALDKGFQPMAMAGFELALQGITSVSEIRDRVARPVHLKQYAQRYKEFILQHKRALAIAANNQSQ